MAKFIIVSAVPFLIGPSRCPIGLEHEASVESVATSSSPGAEEEEEEKEGEVSTKKPAMVILPEDMTAMQIDCGTFHTGRALLCMCCYNV